MLISVVIPVFNVPIKLLRRSVQSVAIQGQKDVEIVLVDDGSDAENAASYQALCNEYEEISCYRKDNGGSSAARNYGVEKSKGEYILFVDADDYVTDKCLEEAKEAIGKYHPDILFGYVFKDLSDEGNIKHQTQSGAEDALVIENQDDMAALLNHMLGYADPRFAYENGYISDGPWCRFFRRTLFRDTPFDVVPRWNEDTLWNIELLKACRKAVICKSLWYVYAVRRGSAMQAYRKQCYEEFLYITEKVPSVGASLWNGHIDKGTAYRVWHDIFILSRALIFNSKNNSTFVEKYRMLKDAISTEAYQRAIRSADFHRERGKHRRAVKELLNTAMKLRCYFLSYLIIRLYVGRVS